MSKSLPWFRVYHEFASDPVIQSMAFEDQRHFIILLCLKCDGTLDKPLPDHVRGGVIAKALGLDRKNAQDAKSRLMDMLLVDHEWQPVAWDKRQFKSDGDSTATERKRRQRRKVKPSENNNIDHVTDESRVTVTNVTRPDTDTDADTEEKHESPNGDLSPPMAATSEGDRKRQPPCQQKKIIDAYKRILPELPTVHAWPEQSARHLKTRWREDPGRQSLEWWEGFFGYVRDCDFLMGRANDFTASLQWLVRPTNFAKVVNGNYENKRGAA